MAFLALAVLAFAVWHLMPVLPSLKTRVQGRLGAVYGPVFGIVSIVLLGMIVLAWRASEFVHVYDPPAFGRHVTFTLVLVAFVCLGIFIFRGRLRHLLRYPLAIAVIFWGTGHLFSNGDLASIILFSGMIAYAAAHLVLGFIAGHRPEGEARAGHDMLSILGGLALYGLMTQLHPVIIGVPVLILGG